VGSSEVRTRDNEFIGAALLPPLDGPMCRVFFLAVGAGALAILLGWKVAGGAAILFGLLALWLAAQLAAAPCVDDESCD